MYTKLHKKNIAIIIIAMIITIFAFNVTTNAKSNKNAPYNTSSKTFKNNVNGFFTADTWYRPKMINENGNHWRKSKSNEYRPLLTVWWPNEDIQMSYTTFMIQHSLGKGIKNLQNKTLKNEEIIIQKNIEKKIYKTKSTKWLNKLIKKFINEQKIWNINSEILQDDGLQNGFLSYKNSKYTKSANSKYRLFGKSIPNRLDNAKYSPELLLANDIDNSNPTVQSEQLNLLYYMMNLGTNQYKNKNGNFDSIRVDATGNVDADILDVAKNYFEKAYKTNKNEKNSNNHLSISEGFRPSNKISTDMLNISGFGGAINSSLSEKPSSRNNLSKIADEFKNNNNELTYSYVNSHDDSDANKTFITIIPKHKKVSENYKNELINSGIKKLNDDRNKTNKSYTKYNTVSSYSVLLNGKNIVPRIYYGDLYNDTDKFMQTKSQNFDSIKNLLKTRKKYVSGNQITNTTHLKNDDLLTISRTGKSETQGSAVVLSNNPNLKVNDNEKVKVSMGVSHKNQKFRPVLESNKNGITNYTSDKKVNENNIKTTNENGDFYLDKNDILGVSNPQVSGYLSVWVPMGSKGNQDARTKASSSNQKSETDLRPGDALNSNVIFEGFSSYQAKEKNPSTYRKIAKNAKLFNQLGITYYEFPPTYRSSKGNSFQDETFENGYAIKDRYDYGYKKPTKYGTTKELVTSIEKLHKNNVKAMADFVPNQVYDLPKKELVNVTRTDWTGKYIGDGAMKNRLYLANSKGSGKDYQAKFGGKYLKELKKKYPSIFKQKQISTGKTIDNSGKRIKTWSAKYLNGTNIQGRGSDYVLRDDSTGKYYKVGEGKHIPNNFLK